MKLFLIYSCIAIPVWVAQFALYFFLRRAGRMKESLAAKCAGSFLAVGSAALGMAFSHEGPGTPWVFWFFVLCTIADALLEISFVNGMLVFGAGHVCLILWLWGLATPSWWSLALWVAAYILTAILFRKELPTLGKLTAPFLLYGFAGGSLALGLRWCSCWAGSGGPWLWSFAVLHLRHAGGEKPAGPGTTSGRSPSWPCIGEPCTSSAWGCGCPASTLEKETIPGHRQRGRDMKEKTRRKLVWKSIFAQW